MASTSFATRLFLVLTLCIAGAVSISTLIDYQWAKRDILQEVELLTELTITDTMEDMDARIDAVESATRLFARILSQRHYSEAEMSEMLREVVAAREDIFGATIALDPSWSDSPRGFAPYYYHNPSAGLEYADLTQSMDYPNQSWFRGTRSSLKTSWSEPYFDEGGGNVLMATFSVPLFRELAGKQQFLGVATADLALTELSRQMRAFQLGDTGRAFLLSKKGSILAAPGERNLMKPLLSILPPNQEIARWGDVLLAAQQGVAASFTGPCINVAGQCVVKVTPLHSNGWLLGVIYSEYEMLEPLRRQLIRLALTGLLGVVLIAIAVSVVSRRLTRPLAALVTVTDNIAAGNLAAPMPKVRRQDEVGRLISSFATMQTSLRDHIKELEQETARRNRLQGELNAASDIQLAMLPDAGNSYLEDPRFQLWAFQRPAKAVGGDLYTYSLRGESELIFAVGDVSDKGVPAALFMARAVTVLQQQLYGELNPARAMERLNNELEKGNENCMFVTLFFGVLNLHTLQLTFASAGHTPPSLLRDGQAAAISQESGPALALRSGLEYSNNSLLLKRGDLLAIYTDGIDEAFNEAKEQFTSERLDQLLVAKDGGHVPAMGKAIFDAVDEHAGSMPQSDDITCMLLCLPQRESKMSTLQVGADLSAVKELLFWLRESFALLDIDATTESEVLLISEEVLSNIIKYADLTEQACITIDLAVNADVISLRFVDGGKAFNPLTEARGSELEVATEHAEIGGLGVHLWLALTDSQHYQRAGNQNILELTKQIPTGDTPET
jgi:phosphoserine phosphatase RsbU/P